MPPPAAKKAARPVATRTAEFMLPFDCTPEYSLQISVPSTDAEQMPHCYREINIQVPPDACENSETGVRHIIRVDDCVLLRPATNASAPFVGRLVALFRMANTATAVARARIQWYYRPSDVLGKTPGRAYGEDEVLQTPHFNDVDVDTIVGRCTVDHYFGAYQIDVAPGIVKTAACDDDGGGDDADCDGAGSDDSDFADYYSSASTRLICRDYYDACADMTTTAAFDDPEADPAAEIAAAAYRDSSEDDAAAFENSDSSHSSDDELEADEVDDSVAGEGFNDCDDGRGKQKRRRKRGHSTVPASIRKKRKHGGRDGDDQAELDAPQFCLPANIGMGGNDLPCRDLEKARVQEFLETAIRESGKGADTGDRCLYISGVPGTGKTATVREIVGKLKTLLVDGSIPPFDVVEVNGMSTPDPNLVYSQLYSAVVGKRGVPHARAQQLLQARFHANNANTRTVGGRGRGSGRPAGSGPQTFAREQGKCVVLILDEMDVLVSRKQQVLYDLLEWTTQKNSRLAVIGIANTMDLPERLMPKIKSRMGDNRLVYEPYTSSELMIILNLRLKNAAMPLEMAARKLVAAKVAAISGDVRRALDLCRRATEMAEADYKSQAQAAANKESRESSDILDDAEQIVKVIHVNSAVNEMTGGSRLKVINNLAVYERLILVCVLALSRSTGTFDVDVSSSLAAVLKESQSSAANLPKVFPFGPPTTNEFESAVARLATLRVVLVERSIKPLLSRIVVNLSPEDCSFALMEDPIARFVLHGKRKRPRAD
jgi:origin recognition complex subunit 1